MIKADKTFDINYIDASGLCEFNRCPAKYMLSRLMGLQKPERTMLAADYGTDIHEALPYCYSQDTLEQAKAIFKKGWEKRSYEDDDKRNIDCAENTIMDFTNSHCELCPYTIINFDIAAPTQAKVSKNEVPFLIDIGGPLALAGRIDAPVRWNSDSTLWALDYKTSGEVSPRLFSNFENSPQSIAYTLALSQLTGERARGMIIEAIRVSKKNCESQMYLVFVKDHQIADFLEFTNLTASRILLCNEKKEWPTQCSGCATYSMFGHPGYVCDYISICDAPDHHEMFKFFDKRKPFHPFIVDTGEQK